MIASILTSILAAAIGGASPVTPAPIRIVAEPRADGIQLSVVGDSEAEYDALYTLEVESDVVQEGGSRSVQRGRARLRPGEVVTLISLRLGRVVPGRWEARLLVEPSEGESYTELRNSI